MSGSWKFTSEIRPGELPGLLRRLADALEGRPDPELAGLPAQDFRKLVLVAERSEHKDDGLELRLKAKRAHEVLVPAAPKPDKPATPRKEAMKTDSARRDPVKKEKYRQLKKALQADFKVLERTARAGILPTEETLESFLSLAQIMVEMDAAAHADPDMARAGAAFLEDVLALGQAFHRHDTAALAEILGRLDRRRGACHAQFK